MIRSLALFPLIFLCLTAAVWATDPPAAVTPLAAVPAAAAAPPVQTATSAGTPAAAAGDDEATVKRLRTAGYKPKKTDGGPAVYCRKELPIGSRIPVENCGTARQIDDATANSQEVAQYAQRTGAAHIKGAP